MYLKHVITAGILSAALAIGPGAVYAQSTGSTSGTSGSSQGTTSGSTSSQPSTGSSQSSAQGASSQSSSGGADQEAVRQHLTGAREALAELTKLPAAGQLQGEQRQKIAQFISDFNAFATATTDWRPKYETVDRALDELLGVSGSASAAGAAASGAAPGATAGTSASAGATTGSTTGSATDPAASGSAAVGTSGDSGAGGLDPTIQAKLREVRTHLDKFEEASGDPTFVVEKIEKILDDASSGGSASGAVGTSGSSASDGAVTLTASQVQEIRRQLDSIKAAAKR